MTRAAPVALLVPEGVCVEAQTVSAVPSEIAVSVRAVAANSTEVSKESTGPYQPSNKEPQVARGKDTIAFPDVPGYGILEELGRGGMCVNVTRLYHAVLERHFP